MNRPAEVEDWQWHIIEFMHERINLLTSATPMDLWSPFNP